MIIGPLNLDPTTVHAVLIAAAALLADFVVGVVTAIIARQFSLQEFPRQLEQAIVRCLGGLSILSAFQGLTSGWVSGGLVVSIATFASGVTARALADIKSKIAAL